MILTSKDTLGGYRIEFCSQSDEEEKILKEFEKYWHNEEAKKLKKLKT